MAGVAIENRVFCIVPSARDTPFIDARVAFLTPKMDLSQVMPSGCNLCCVAIQPKNQLAIPERPSASDVTEDQSVVDPAAMQMDLATAIFQPYRGATGRAWMAQEYGITADTSSAISSASGTERYDTDEEVCSFDLGPEPYDPEAQGRLPSDEWMDDYQQGLVPGPERPSASDVTEDQSVVDPAAMQMDLATAIFQPYRGATGRAWMAQEYGITADTSSAISSASGTERYDTDEEVCSFDLGPEPYDPEAQGRLPSDEWMDDYQQRLVPGGSEPRNVDYNKYLAMPRKPSLLDMMRQEIEDSEEVPPKSPERMHTPTSGFEFEYATNAPPDIQRMVDVPMHSTPYPDPPTLSARPGPNLLPPRPRSSSVPPTPKTVQRMAIRYMPVTETVTPPISPARATAMHPQSEADTPSPKQKPGRSRGRGKWRAPQLTNPGVGTRSRTKQIELDPAEATQAQASRATWPPRPDNTDQLQRMTRELQLEDRPQDAHRDMLRILPVHKLDQNQNVA